VNGSQVLAGLELFTDDAPTGLSRAHFVDTQGDSGHVKASGTWGSCVKSARCPVGVEAVQRSPLRGVQAVRCVRPEPARLLWLPGVVAADLRPGGTFVKAGPEELIFTGAKGAPLRSGNFGRAVKWTKTVASVGLAGFHFHDLRHTGNTLAAASGASTRELMHRMGHATMRAALIYQHATSERDREIASAMDRRIAGEGRRRR
jgi:Phage integrase family